MFLESRKKEYYPKMRQDFQYSSIPFLYPTSLKKIEKTSGFLIPDVGRKMKRWTEMGEYSY